MKITAGQQPMPGLFGVLTGQTFNLLVILTGLKITKVSMLFSVVFTEKGDGYLLFDG